MEDELVLGIDLGTSNCLVAVFRDGRVEYVENESGTRTMPPYVTFSENERLIGEMAKHLVVDEPENTVYDVKRWIGTRFDNQQIQDEIGRWTFNVRENRNHDGMASVVVKLCGIQMEFGPEEFSAMILERLKQTAENYLEEPVTKAIISVPAYFNNWQRQATIDAGKIAGLEVLAIINEPTAAALCYGMKKSSGQKNKTVLVFDLGGGTFDVSVVSIEDSKIVVRSTAGDCHLGGNDFDNALVDHCVDIFKAQHELDPSTDKCAMQRLRLECERAKVRLSTSKQTSISVDYLFSQQHFSLSISRTQFEDLCKPYLARLMSLVSDVVQPGGCHIEDIILVGGSTRIPIIRQQLQDHFRLDEIKPNLVNPDLAVVSGAAIYGAILNHQNNCHNFSLVDVCSHSFGYKAVDGQVISIVQRNSPLPCFRMQFNPCALHNLINPEKNIVKQLWQMVQNCTEKVWSFKANEPVVNQVEGTKPNCNARDNQRTKSNIYKIYEGDLVLGLSGEDNPPVPRVETTRSPVQTRSQKSKSTNVKIENSLNEEQPNQRTYHEQFVTFFGQLTMTDNQEVTVVIDKNGILNVTYDSISRTALCKRYRCLSEREIREKQAVLHRLQLTEQQYHEMLVQKNHLETIMFSIKSQLEPIYSVICPILRQRMQTALDNLDKCYIKQEPCKGRPKKVKHTKDDIVKYQAELVGLYKFIIRQQFELPVDNVVVNQQRIN